MKKVIFLLLVLLYSSNGISQERNAFISFRGGYSYPVGKFAGYDLENGSFADIGINASIEGGWYFSPYLGIGGEVGINLHPLNLQELAIAKIAADPFLSDLKIRSEEFLTIINATGFYGKSSFRKKFQINGKLLAGIMLAKTPYQIYKPEYFIVGPEYYEITPSTDYNFLFMGGAGLHYSALSYLHLKIEGEYCYSKMTFRFNTANGMVNDQKKIGFINLTFGLVVLL